MALLDFWKKRVNRISLNKQISRLKQDFQEEIRDFEHFKQLQIKKIEILRKIKEIWNKRWREAEELITLHIPNLITKQLELVERDIRYISEEDFILRYLLEIEERRNSILGSHLSQNVNQEHLEFFRSARNADLINQLRGALTENSSILEEHFLKLRESLNKPLQFLKKANSWQAINQNEEFLEYLKEEELLTQRIEHVINDVINKIRDIMGFELERIREESRLKELRRTKVYVRSVDCELTLGDIEKIVKGELPLVYYHGTPLDSLDIIFEQKCLISHRRLELLKRVKQLQREKHTNWRQKIIELTAQYDSEYKRETDFFKKMVILKEESQKLADELLSRMYLAQYHPQINEKIALKRGSVFPLQLLKIISQIKELIKNRLELIAESKDVSHYISTKIRELENKAKVYVLSLYIDLNNLRPETNDKEGFKLLYKRLENSRDFQEYFTMFFKYIEARLIVEILDESLAIPLNMKPDNKRALYVFKLNLFSIRDKWFVFFGAEPPFRTRTDFRACEGFGTPLLTIGIITGIVLEFKPTIEPFIEWVEIQTGGLRQAIPAAIYGKLTYDIITKKKINFDHLLRIYTAKKDMELVNQKMREHNINVPLNDFDEQSELFRQMMVEMKQILINRNLLAR